VIGAEVASLGGATQWLEGLQVTSTAAAAHTLTVHRRAFEAAASLKLQ
jgi:D-tagatose-1,6-bisphosphate aldolase subunit GatZ/KbaZ